MNRRTSDRFSPRKLWVALVSAGVIGGAGLAAFDVPSVRAAAPATVPPTIPFVDNGGAGEGTSAPR